MRGGKPTGTGMNPSAVPLLHGPAIFIFTKCSRFVLAGIVQPSSLKQLFADESSREWTEMTHFGRISFALFGQIPLAWTEHLRQGGVTRNRRTSVYRGSAAVSRRNRVHAQSAPDIPGNQLDHNPRCRTNHRAGESTRCGECCRPTAVRWCLPTNGYRCRGVAGLIPMCGWPIRPVMSA